MRSRFVWYPTATRVTTEPLTSCVGKATARIPGSLHGHDSTRTAVPVQVEIVAVGTILMGERLGVKRERK